MPVDPLKKKKKEKKKKKKKKEMVPPDDTAGRAPPTEDAVPASRNPFVSAECTKQKKIKRAQTAASQDPEEAAAALKKKKKKVKRSAPEPAPVADASDHEDKEMADKEQSVALPTAEAAAAGTSQQPGAAAEGSTFANSLVEQAVTDNAEPEFVARLMVLLYRTLDWNSAELVRCINAACPGHLDLAAFNEPLKEVLSSKNFINTIRCREGLSRLAAARGYVALRAVVKIRSPVRLQAISAGWSLKEKCKLVELIIEDCVDSVSSCARFVAKAAGAFGWKKKKRRRLMQYVVDTECFGQLFGEASEVLDVMPDLKSELHLPADTNEDEEPDSEDLEFINDGRMDFSDTEEDSSSGSSSLSGEAERESTSVSEEVEEDEPLTRPRSINSKRRRVMCESD